MEGVHKYDHGAIMQHLSIALVLVRKPGSKGKGKRKALPRSTDAHSRVRETTAVECALGV